MDVTPDDVPAVEAGGATIPKLGVGTWRMRGRECTEAVERALEMGYRHVDTAEYYDNHRAVGEGLARAAVDREDVFLTTKVWRTNLRAADVRRSVEQALEDLGVDDVDLLLIHWPNRSVPVEETLGAMAEYHPDRVRHLGISNFSVSQLREAREAVDVPVVADQVEYHPHERRDDLLTACIDDGVCLTAYSPLAKGRLVDDDTLVEIGERHDRTAAQVALRWLLQQPNVAAIPKASSEAHLRENLGAFGFELSGAEMDRIFGMEGGLPERLRSRLGL
jgi:diketogulonate reductase-like aldo/keto reductase